MKLVECQIFAAFVAPLSDVFWQPENSESVRMLKEIMKVIPLKNEIQYRTNFDTFIWKFKSMSSALFSEWEYT